MKTPTSCGDYGLKRKLCAVALMLLGISGLLTAQADLAAWTSEATGGAIVRTETAPAGADLATPLPTVIYLQNLSSPRPGRESDATIIGSFLADGLLVVTMNYAGHDHARWPSVNVDLVNIRKAILADGGLGAGEPRAFETVHTMDPARIYIVPGGCRLLRNVVYESPRGMDIIYPADPRLPVGAVLQFTADNLNRMGNFSMAVTHDSMVTGLASLGFVTAMADHPVSGGYNGIDPMPASAWSVRSAVKTLRAQAAQLPMNGRIATLGFSRGSGVALMGVTTAQQENWNIYIGPNDSKVEIPDTSVAYGSNPTEDGSVQGAVIMSGRFTYIDLLPTDGKAAPNGLYTNTWGPIGSNFGRWRDHGALDYLKADPGYPLFLTINADDEHAHHQMDVLQSRLTELGVDYVFREDTVEPLAHRMPQVPAILDHMEAYLKQVLLNPNPEEMMLDLQLRGERVIGNEIRWRVQEDLPAVGFIVQRSPDLSKWTDWQTLQPDSNGVLEFNTIPTDAEGGFVRLVVP